MTTPCGESVSLGAYLLGALDPAERAAMQEHIAQCPHCRRELLELAPLPGLLRHTPFEELPQSAAAAQSPGPAERWPVEPWPIEPPVPGPAAPSGPSVSAAATAGQHGPRGPFRARKGRLVAAGAVLAAVAAGAVVYTGVSQDHSSRPVAAATWSATNPGTHVSASAALTPEVWGTEFQLKLAGLPSNITCRLVVHGSDGRSETAGTWGSGYSASASVPASTSISPSQITELDIVNGARAVLVRVPPG